VYRKAGKGAHQLLEREVELTQIRSTIEAARSGRGSLTLLIGSPGIGKSAILDASVAAAGIPVLRARAGELEREFPYGVMRQLLEGTLRNAPADDRAELLSGAAAPAGALIDAQQAISADSIALDHAFYWLIANLSESEPLVLAVDDAHWSDIASLRTLVYIARRVRDLPVALLIASRPADSRGARLLLEHLEAESQGTLKPALLSDAAVSKLIRQRLPAADESFCLACYQATGGNPFLVSELSAAVDASGVEPMSSNSPLVQTIGPETVQRSVLLRIQTLPREAEVVARALAVAGESARIDLVAKLAEVDAQTAAHAIDGLRRLEILADEAPPRFIHSIVHAAVYEGIPRAVRSQLHRHAAELLAAEAASPDAIAAQLLATDPSADPWVAAQLMAAAGGGLAQSAPETMAAYAERALAEAVPDLDRTQLLFFCGAARFQTIEGGGSEPLLEALALADSPELQLDIVLAASSALIAEGRYAEGWELAEEWLERLAPTPELAARLELGMPQRLFGEMGADVEREIRRINEWDVDPAGATGTDRSRLALKGWVEASLPRPADVAADMARAALSTGTLVVDDTWFITFDLACWTLLSTGCYDELHTYLDQAIGQLRTMGRLMRASSLLPIRSELHRRCGRLELAEEDARIAFEIVPIEQVYAPHTACALTIALLERGDLEGARHALVHHGFAEEIPRGGVNDVLWFARGRLRIAEGDAAGGVEDILRYGEISEAARRRNPGYFPWRSTAAEALARSGEREQATSLATEELELAEAVGLRELRAAPLRALAAAAPSGERAVELLSEALDALRGSKLQLERLRTQLALGIALRHGRKREDARTPLREVLEAATRIGADPLAARARDELLATGARPRRTALQGIDALTPSEHRVAALAARGQTNRQIAQTLYVTTKTVEAHLRNAYDKLGVSGKRDLPRVIDPSSAEPVAQPA
jgi:DNA-binding CsgD family transcriptional regulator